MHGAPGLPPPLHASLCAGLMQDLAGGVCHLQTHPAMGLHGGHGRARADPHMPGTRWHSKTPPREDLAHACVRCGCDNLPAPTHLPGRLAPRGGHFPKAAVVRIGTHTHIQGHHNLPLVHEHCHSAHTIVSVDVHTRPNLIPSRKHAMEMLQGNSTVQQPPARAHTQCSCQKNSLRLTHTLQINPPQTHARTHTQKSTSSR